MPVILLYTLLSGGALPIVDPAKVLSQSPRNRARAAVAASSRCCCSCSKSAAKFRPLVEVTPPQ
jgi:hypothetical protein